MKELDLKSLPLMEFDVPKGESAENCLEGYLGTRASAHEDMPADEDVDGTVFIKLK